MTCVYILITYSNANLNLFSDTTPFNEFEIVSTKDLIRWSYEIARGMEYLELKKVIHGDLATRNILLNSKRIPKISDFGLARQLYAYSVYVKKQNVMLIIFKSFPTHN